MAEGSGAQGLGIRATLMRALTVGAAAAASMPGQAADLAEAADIDMGGDIVVTGFLVSGLSDPRAPLPLLETPLSATVIADELLAEQGRRTLRDALRNITGLSFQAGEGNPPGGGDSFSIRGFAARDDIYVDGIRDPGNYFRDPFNAERVEVTKGPASAFAGRGNIGGTVNIVTRRPVLENRRSAELGVGTDNFFRATADVNVVLAEESGAAFRLNMVGHQNDEPGRDIANGRRWGITPALAVGLGTPTRFEISHFHMEQDDLPDMGIPNARNRSFAGSGFEGKPVPVNRRNFYGYSTDFREVTTDITTIRFEQDLGGSGQISNVTRYARVAYAQEASSPRFVGNPTSIDATTQAVGNRKPRQQLDTLGINQTQLAIAAGPDSFRHNIVVGLEISAETTENRRRLDADGPRMNLFRPELFAAPPIPFNGTRARIDIDTVSAYIFDTIEIGERVRVLAGVRYDDVSTRVRGFDSRGIAPQFVTDLERTDREWSGNIGLVFKPAPNASLYVAWGTAFEPSARAEIVQVAGGNNNPPVTPGAFQVAPERSRAFELGGKLDLNDGRLNLGAAVFEILQTNGRTPGVNPGDPPVVLEGRQRVRGLELQAVGNLTPEWKLFAGYTFLDGKVTRSNIPVQVGLRTDNTPEHSVSVWTSYNIAPAFTLGGGLQHVSERLSNIPTSLTSGNFVVTVPAYTVLDAFAEWRIREGVAARVNVYNLADETYFFAFNSAQSIPAPGRSAVLTLALDF
jgi:catecholate siderophore receptor